MKKGIIFILGLIVGALLCMGLTYEPKQQEQTQTPEEYREEIIALSIQEAEEIKKERIERPREVMELPKVEPVTYQDEFYIDELLYLAKCVEAEAGNQDQLGKRLVVDVILNRVDSMEFPDTITEVINQQGQFSVVANGSIEKQTPNRDTWEAIALELERRTDTNVLYFKTGGLHSFCKDGYQHGAHFFGW